MQHGATRMSSNPPKLPEGELQSIALAPNAAISDKPDEHTEIEELKLENERLDLQSKVQDVKHRRIFAISIFVVMCIWLALIAVTVFFQGFKLYGFELASSVLITLIGSTTGSIIGIFLIVSRYLFHRDQRRDQSK
jgi:hypothetical protein